MAEGGVANIEVALTDDDKALLTLAQIGVPLTQRPFGALGEVLGLTESHAIARLRILKDAGFIRKIGPVIEPRALGLASELVAARVLPERLDQIGAAVAAWPEVTHCYAREHEINLWFAGVAAAPEWFEWAATQVAEMDGAQGAWRLPTIRRFKIAVHFDVEETKRREGEEAKRGTSEPDGSSVSRFRGSIGLLRVIQSDLPLCAEPFRELSERSGIDSDEIIRTLIELVNAGVVRRYGALVSHRRLGFVANAMVVMAVPPERIEEAGARLAESPHVSHCYQRPTLPEFPYNLYAMVHDRDRSGCLDVARGLAESAEATEWRALFSTKEYRKSTPDYARLLEQRLGAGEDCRR